MKRMHVHIAVENIQESVRFYSSLFSAEPTILKNDYAKWQLDDPRVNFAISNHNPKFGLDHLGIQVEDNHELQEMNERLSNAALPFSEQTRTSCCYAVSDKYWTTDPQGIAWETFHTLDSVPIYGEEHDNQTSACCAPEQPAEVKKTSTSCGTTGCC